MLEASSAALDRGGGIVLYAQDTAPYALVWPLGVLALSPLAFGSMTRAVARSPDIQLLLQMLVCSLTAGWLAHDVVWRARFAAWPGTMGRYRCSGSMGAVGWPRGDDREDR